MYADNQDHHWAIPTIYPVSNEMMIQVRYPKSGAIRG